MSRNTTKHLKRQRKLARRKARMRRQINGEVCGQPPSASKGKRVCHYYAGHDGHHEWQLFPEPNPCDCHEDPRPISDTLNPFNPLNPLKAFDTMFKNQAQ